MREKGIGQKCLSMLICISMLFSIMIDSVTVSAADAVKIPEYSDSKADIFYRYMGTSPANTDFEDCEMPSGNISDFEWKAGDYVWVGVYVRYMPRIKSMFEDNGLTNLTVALLYNSTYLDWNTLDSTNTFSFLDGVNDFYVDEDEGGVKTATYPYKEGKKWNTPYYETGVKKFALSTLQDTEKEWNSLYPIAVPNYEDVNEPLYVAQQSIKADGSPDELMFKGSYLKDEEVLVAIYPLKMKATEPPTGTKFLEGTFGPSTFVVNSGDDSYNFVIREDEDAGANLINKFNIVDNVVNLKPATYTVEYDANGGTYPDGFDNTEKVPEDTKPTFKKDNVDISSKIEPPTNMVFDGWYTAATGGDRVDDDPNYKVTSDNVTNDKVTLFAHYTTGYKVTFKLNAPGDATAKFANGKATDQPFTAGSTDPIFKTGETLADLIGTTDPVATDPTRTDYTFMGWYTQKSNGSFDTKYEEADIKALRTSTDLYAMWKYTDTTVNTLTFDKNLGDTDANPTSVGYNDGDTLQKLLGGLPQEPTRANYKFLGWYLTPSGDGERLTADKVLNTYTENNTKTTVYARWGDVTTQPDDPDVTPSPLTPESDAVKVHFEKDADGTYGGGTYDYGTVNDKYIKEGDAIGAVPTTADMKHDTKKFDGWYTKPFNETNPTDKGTKVTSTTTINDAGLGTGVIQTVDGKKEVTLYPHWLSDVTLKYDLNGMPGTAPADVTGTPGEQKFTAPATVTGQGANYTITAWSTSQSNDPTATGYKTFAPGSQNNILDDNMTLYAIWDYTGADKVEVTFKGNDSDTDKAELNPNDGTPNENEYKIYRAPGYVIEADQMPSATRAKYDFNHWDTTKTAAAGAQQSITVSGTAGNTSNAPMDIYAIWTVKSTETPVTVNFDLNDDVAAPASPKPIASVTIAKGDSLGSLMPADPTRSGYGFKQWEYPTGTKFEATTVVNVDGPITVTATWEAKVTVEYDLNGLTGTKPASVIDVPDGTKTFTPPTAANVTGLDSSKYTITAWSTSPSNDPTAKKFTPGQAQTLTESLKLYAIWDYTGSDKVEVVFDGNDTTLKQATLNPNDGTTPANKYKIYRQPGTNIDPNHFPTATRPSYTFNHWNVSATAPASNTTPPAQPTITVAGTDGKMNVYAIWTVTNQADEITISYDLNGATTPASIDSFKIAKGDCVGSRMTTVTPTKTNADFLGWAKSTETSYTTAFDTTEALTTDTTIKAFWQNKVTITFDKNGGNEVTIDTTHTANTSLDPITLPINTKVEDRTDNPKDLPRVKKDNYEFQGWFYEDDTTHQLVELTKSSEVKGSITVKAKWKGEINVKFEDTEFPYDNGNAITPLKPGNYTVDLLAAPDYSTVAEQSVTIPGLTITTKYKVKGAADSTATTDIPSAIGVYELLETSATGGDDYTVYGVHSIPTDFKITATINYVVANNYQYDPDKTKTSFSPITVTKATDAAFASFNPNLDFINDAANSDIKVTFENVKDSTKKFENVMPNEYGEYSITIKETDNSPYVVNQVTDSITTAANPKLYLICQTRTIKYELGAQANPTTLTEDVVIPTPSPIQNVNDAKTTLAGNSKTLPVGDGTDFTPPTGKRLCTTTKAFETRAAGDTEGSGTEFKTDTEILWGTDDLVVYALYENADWTLKFTDTKTTAENFDDYTVDADKSVAQGLKKIGTTDVGATDPKELPAPTAAPTNRMFLGWTTDATLAANHDLTSADFAEADVANSKPAGQYYGKLFTKDTVPTAADLTNNELNVHAVYVKSSDATLKAASFKEILVVKDSDGNPTGAETEMAELPFANPDYSEATTPITFDPAKNTYTVVVENDFEKVLANLEPSQSDSTIKITVNGVELTNTGYTKGDRSDKVSVDATVYDEANDENSVNTIVVTVTAPDNTTKTYTFNVLRYAEITMTLRAGNSPYGLIERMGADYVSEREVPTDGSTLDVWDADKIQEAKEKFDNNGAINKKYVAGFVPDDGETNLKYVSEAWRDYKDGDGNIINYDLDPTALFVYIDAIYKLPGCIITDKFGKVATDETPTIDLSLDRQQKAGAMDYKSDDNIEKDYRPQLVDGSTDLYSLKGIMVRMNVYDMTYTYNYTQDNGTSKTITKIRPIVVISKRGDIILNTTTTVNDSDVDYLRDNQTTINTGESLVAYRCMDFIVGDSANSTPTVNDSDVDYLRDNQTTVNTSSIQFYKKLK